MGTTGLFKRSPVGLAGIVLAVLLSCALVGGTPWAFAEETEETSVTSLLQGGALSLREMVGAAEGESIYGSEKMVADDSVCQWIAFDFSRLGLEKDAAVYLDKLEEYVTESYQDSDVLLDKNKSTEWNRASIVIHALGGDPTAFGTGPEGNEIDLVRDGSYDWTRTNSLGIQGANGWAFALTVLDTCEVEIPDDALYSKDDMISGLLAMQSPDGGFGLDYGSSSADITSMSVVALAPHQNDPAVKAALDRAVDYLSEMQGSDGRYISSEGIASSESSSQVVMALCALQLNPKTDERFIKDGSSVFDGLVSYRNEDGSFRHSDDEGSGSDSMATEQAVRALIAMSELEHDGDGNVYTLDVELNLDMGSAATDEAAQGGAGSDSALPWIIGICVVVIIAVVAVVAVRNKRRKALENERIGK